MWNGPVSSAESKHARSCIWHTEIRVLTDMPSHTFTYSGAASVITNCYPLYGGTYCENPVGQFDVPVAFIQQTSPK